MKSGWAIKSVGEIVKTLTPPLKVPAKSYLSDGRFPVVSQDSELISGYSNETKGVMKVFRPLVIFGDHTKVVKYIDFDFVQGADGVKILNVADEIDPKLFYYAVRNIHLRNLGYARHFKLLKESELCYPTSEKEQKRIVAKIDAAFEKIDKLKANAERNLAKAKELFQSALDEAMRPKKDWMEKRLGEVCKITSVLVDPTEKEYRNLLHVGGANIVSEIGSLVDLKTAAEEKLKSGKFTFDESMVLYNKIRPYLTKVARPDFKGLCSADMYPLSPVGGVERDFLYYLLLSTRFTTYAIGESERAGMPKVNRESLFGYELKMPPNQDEQRGISRALDQLREKLSLLRQHYTRQIADCAEMHQSVLREAFEGRL